VATASVLAALRTRNRLPPHSGEGNRQVLSLTHDGDRYAGCLQTQEPGLRMVRASGEARRLDVDERDRSSGERALEQPADEGRLDTRGHDHELERA
jgi:hypothetical protein